MITALLKLKKDLKDKIDDLSFLLKLKEFQVYKHYLENGGNPRTAGDKVISEVKMTDNQWLTDEKKLNRLETDLVLCADAIQIIKTGKFDDEFCEKLSEEIYQLLTTEGETHGA